MASLTTSDGRTLGWRVVGSGPPLLCHPGGPGCSSAYFGDLSLLATERTLLLLDPRGTGASDRPADPAAYDLEQYAADVEAVREHLALDRADLLGHSHGGFVAMTWAGTHPERVGRLVLANTTPRFTDAIRAARQERARSHEGQPYYEDAMDALRAHQQGRFASDDELTDLYRREMSLFAPVGADIAPVGEAMARAGTNADALRHFNEVVSGPMDLRPLLARIEAPTLVIGGALDPFGPPAQQEIADALPDATLVILPGADHFPFLEPGQGEKWQRAVLEFLTA
jgi:pimeloyl-ACP methyl ester carboxylesterase